MQEHAVQLDARGLTCPLPVLKTRKAVNRLSEGQILELLSSDPGSTKDIHAFCHQTGHEFLSSEERDGAFVIRIRKA